MHLYRPDHRAPFRGIVILAALAIAAGLLAGLLLAALAPWLVSVARWLPAKLVAMLLIAGPLLLGAVGGLVLSTGVGAGKVRHPAVAEGAGLLFTLTVVLISLGGFFVRAHPDTLVTIPALLDYVRTIAREGLMPFAGVDDPSRLGGPWFWVLLGAMFVLGSLPAMSLPHVRASKPFCPWCGQWYREKIVLGWLPATALPRLAQMLRERGAAQAERLLTREQGVSEVGLTLLTCPHDVYTEQVVTVVVNKSASAKRLEKPLFHLTVSPSELEALRAMLTETAPV